MTFHVKIYGGICINCVAGRTATETDWEGRVVMSGAGRNQGDVKAVIFDYGEVLCHRPTLAQMTRLAGFFGVGLDVFYGLWERNRGPYDRGDLTAEAYWSMLAHDAGAQIGPGQMEEICQLDMAMWSNVNSNMVEWARQLGASGMKVGLLSNMPPDMVTHCRKHFSWLNSFDFVTFSGEVKLIKPDPAIYEYMLRGLGVTASDALFLDDREINIQAARALGIAAIRVQSMAQLRSDLHAAGFAVLPASS
jgi:putative hydrolase of the HAD superfamily